MRLRARLTTTTTGLLVALATVTSLSGCMTVRGETAVVPAATETEAEQALERYFEVRNEARRTYDAELNATVETGALADINGAVLIAQGAVNEEAAAEEEASEDGAAQEEAAEDDFTPIEYENPRFHIPQQAGWPKFFMVDAEIVDNETHWLLTFTRHSVDEPWNVRYVSALEPSAIPEFATDDDGYLQELQVASESTGLSVAPGELGTAYTEYLNTGNGPFLGGRYTTDVVAAREAANESPASQTQFSDTTTSEDEYPTVAVRTEDGGALVLFALRMDDKQTWAEGETPVVDPMVKPLMQGTADRAVTLQRYANFTAYVPEGEDPVDLRARHMGVFNALGE
ncbi:hypothetical protein [Streptomyces profundus]|uniref:hypothetical protein n=1 Tax=Streptomyces profundus TaxID=2867410 RepID=UPI001D16104D|nr:hypothetical protein [Streptomyces sp. MA3_2.13]UED83848.1 hypothetical protein K4G22_06160 [Streptomyces sp. MA3_2.13]